MWMQGFQRPITRLKRECVRWCDFKCAVIVIEGSAERTSLSTVVAVILSARGERHIELVTKMIFVVFK